MGGAGGSRRMTSGRVRSADGERTVGWWGETSDSRSVGETLAGPLKNIENVKNTFKIYTCRHC